MIILETDKAFMDSPDAGDPLCICSRCAKQIPEEDAPITRAFFDIGNEEYRYCQACWAGIDKRVMSFEDYRAELIRIAAENTGEPSYLIKVNDAAAREWYDAGIPAYYCFREEW